MADEADIASDYTDRELALSLAGRELPPRPGTTGPMWCPACDEKIPEARRVRGYSVCVECAARDERRMRAGKEL